MKPLFVILRRMPGKGMVRCALCDKAVADNPLARASHAKPHMDAGDAFKRTAQDHNYYGSPFRTTYYMTDVTMPMNPESSL